MEQNMRILSEAQKDKTVAHLAELLSQNLYVPTDVASRLAKDACGSAGPSWLVSQMGNVIAANTGRQPRITKHHANMKQYRTASWDAAYERWCARMGFPATTWYQSKVGRQGGRLPMQSTPPARKTEDWRAAAQLLAEQLPVCSKLYLEKHSDGKVTVKVTRVTSVSEEVEL